MNDYDYYPQETCDEYSRFLGFSNDRECSEFLDKSAPHNASED